MRLVLLIVIWAISWPAIKIGVTTVPPIWFAFLRYVIAAFCLFALVGWRREIALPPRSDWSLIIVSAALQMAAYAALTGVALTALPPGRASVLAYSTPLWVVPLAAWRLQERVSRLGLLGVGLGILGALTIAMPSLQFAERARLHAYVLLIVAAIAWAISIVFVRSHRFTATTLALAPWQMLIAATLLLPLAVLTEGAMPRIGTSALASLAYVGPIATAIAYWMMVEAGRHFRASTIAMALLAVPGVGILISVVALGEKTDSALITGVILIGVGIRLATALPKPDLRTTIT